MVVVGGGGGGSVTLEVCALFRTWIGASFPFALRSGMKFFCRGCHYRIKEQKKAGNNYKNWFAEQRGMNWNIVDNEYPIFFHDVVQCYSNIPTPLFR